MRRILYGNLHLCVDKATDDRSLVSNCVSWCVQALAVCHHSSGYPMDNAKHMFFRCDRWGRRLLWSWRPLWVRTSRRGRLYSSYWPNGWKSATGLYRIISNNNYCSLFCNIDLHMLCNRYNTNHCSMN